MAGEDPASPTVAPGQQLTSAAPESGPLPADASARVALRMQAAELRAVAAVWRATWSPQGHPVSPTLALRGQREQAGTTEVSVKDAPSGDASLAGRLKAVESRMP
jgi:hypothetical protein